MRFLCRIIGHKAISQFDGTARCVRCDKRWYPEQGSWTIHAMRCADPGWWFNTGLLFPDGSPIMAYEATAPIGFVHFED